MPHHQHLCVPMFVKFFVFLIVCKCDFRLVLVAMVVFVNRQLIASLIVIIGSIASPSFHHHPPHILTHSHFSPFHPSPSSQAPPSSYPPPRYIYTSMPSLCVLYTLGCQSFLQPIPCPQAALVQSQPNCRSKPQLFAITDNIPARTIFPRRNDPEPDNLCASYKPSITIGPPTRCRENTHTQNYYLTSSRLFCCIIIHPLDQYPQQPDPEPPLSTAS